MTSATAPAALTAFFKRWQRTGGSERANYQMFISELCALLGVPLPDPARDDTRDNAYVFERHITFAHGDGSRTAGFIDCYRRGHFVLEAKRIKDGEQRLARGSKTVHTTMLAARNQAESYARALPAQEGRPPLLLVLDVGHLIEVFADFSCSGATYTPFPDVASHRITLAELCADTPAGEAVRARLRDAWLDPMSLDPSRVSAKVTRQVSDLLATLASDLNQAGHQEHSVTAFLTRCLFCMFAEDVELLPRDEKGEGAFTGLLRRFALQPERLTSMLRGLWITMDQGGFSDRLGEKLLRFNGKLFKGSEAPDYVLALDHDQLAQLTRAAEMNWRDVEPAIFGTLLERALKPNERHALGAHYTPRAYVERLVLPTVIEPLRADWADVQAAALLLAREAEALEGKKRHDLQAQAQHEVRQFHHRLCTTRVLDPACGSGNFLYVTLEHLKRLEAEVLDFLATLGETSGRLDLEGETVTLQQLRGIELNPRAAALAELVLWIGWLQWQIRSFGNRSVAEPVVHDYGNIECRDAVLAWDERLPALDAAGQPITRWDGKTVKPHPVTGEDVPDDTAQVPQWRYVNPRQAPWPQADFIVGNPPFIGKLKMREALGDGYVEALRKAWDEVPDSADFVMYWWNKAANAVRSGNTQRMGLITTNSLTMIFNRRVVEGALDGSPAVHLAFAIPDHPWVDGADGAAVRIAMTALASGQADGRLLTVQQEAFADTGEISFVLQERRGQIHSNLKIGAAVTSAKPLQAMRGITSMGVMLAGAGFIVDALTAQRLNSGAYAEGLVRNYRNGRDLTDSPRGVCVIDTFGWELDDLRSKAPEVYQHLVDHVKPEREAKRDKAFRERWWLHGRARGEMRTALAGSPRFIATVETAKHRIFQFLDASILPDHKIIAIALADGAWLGVLSSVVHVEWALVAGGRLGVGNDPVYNKTKCFELFPFPADDTGLTPEIAARIRQLAEQIDAHRKARQAAHDTVTLTGLYNVLAKLRSGEALNPKEKELHNAGLVNVLHSFHNDLDAAVLQAYGWSDLGPVPWADAERRQAWTESLLERLVALNARRAAEEAAGTVRWLRPEFQDPARRAAASAPPSATQTPLALPEPAPSADNAAPATPTAAPASRQPWPAEGKEQLRSVAELLAASAGALTEAQIAEHYTGRGPWKKRLGSVLDTLEAVARAQRDGRGGWRAA